MIFSYTQKILILYLIMVFVLGGAYQLAAQQNVSGAKLKTEGGGLVTRVAPGEFLPISVKLTNFGGGRRVDVTIDYRILDESNKVVLTERETVAVETTASFVKVIQIPYDIPSGKYVAESSIVYEGQEVPAVSNYQFVVERKIAGIFVSQFIIYGTITLLIGIAFAVVSRLIIKKRRASRLTPHEYRDIPQKDRIFYEIISDTIMQMRYRVGDKALDIAKNIDGLVINKENGRVFKVKKSPEKIIALLILLYEKHLGEKVNFAIRSRRSGDETKSRLATVDKNLIVIRKYFE